jgi:hypothetical protein
MKRIRISYFLILISLIVLTSVSCGDLNTNKDSAEEKVNNGIQTSQTELKTTVEASIQEVGENEKLIDSDIQSEEESASVHKQVPLEEKEGNPESDGKDVQHELPKHSEQSAGNENKVTLWVTRDFGKEALLKESTKIENTSSVFDVLQANTEVTTAYSGSFVNEINGIKSDSGGLSGKRQDWFYFVNGVFADVGALEYDLSPGEIVWWDYHPWSGGMANTAVIGAYPEPFLHGYKGKINPTVILCFPQQRSLAERLRQSMEGQGVASVTIKDISEELIAKRMGPTVVLGEWSRLETISYLEELNKAYRKNGTGVHFTEDKVELLNYRGNAVKFVTQKAGFILATGEGPGDENPLWLLVGTDESALQVTVEILVNHPEKIRRFYQAAIVGGELTRLPLL